MKQLFLTHYSLTFRFFLLLFLSIVFIVLDSRFYPFKNVRFYLDTIVSPLYSVSNTPLLTSGYFEKLLENKQNLMELNKKLEIENLQLRASNNLLQALKKDNEALRNLMKSPASQDKFKMLSEVLLIDSDLFNFQIVLNKGKKDGVFDGQPIVDQSGILGQVYQTAYTTSRAILICDYQHAIPIRNLRNNQSMVALGNGCGNDLILEYIQSNADVEIGDVLVSSGLDGVFQTGYPVAKVSRIIKDSKGDNTIIFATPTADIKHIRYVLLLLNDNDVSKNDKIKDPEENE